jgi:N-acetyltransferase
MGFLEPVVLEGGSVVLEPLSREHHDGLVEAVRDGELWKLWYTRIPRPESVADEIDARLARQRDGTMLPFTVRQVATGGVVGMTTFCNADAAAPRVEIGATWLARSVQGTAINP